LDIGYNKMVEDEIEIIKGLAGVDIEKIRLATEI
jgi:hypothetical protein